MSVTAEDVARRDEALVDHHDDVAHMVRVQAAHLRRGDTGMRYDPVLRAIVVGDEHQEPLCSDLARRLLLAAVHQLAAREVTS